jgi:hypothetical protein
MSPKKKTDEPVGGAGQAAGGAGGTGGGSSGGSSSSVPETKKTKTTVTQHPIDVSVVFQSVKDDMFTKFEALLTSQTHLSFEDFNSLPPVFVLGL